MYALRFSRYAMSSSTAAGFLTHSNAPFRCSIAAFTFPQLPQQLFLERAAEILGAARYTQERALKNQQAERKVMGRINGSPSRK
jgi:hypothetical protein